MQKTKSGFTIVELLIVIVVIAILATISIVAYNGIQNRANDTAVESDLRAIAKKLELWRIDNGAYPSTIHSLTTNDLYKVTLTKSAYAVSPQISSNLYYCSFDPYSSYVVAALSKSGTQYYILDGVLGETNITSWGTVACPTVLSGSSYIYPAGYSNPEWRAWTGVAP